MAAYVVTWDARSKAARAPKCLMIEALPGCLLPSRDLFHSRTPSTFLDIYGKTKSKAIFSVISDFTGQTLSLPGVGALHESAKAGLSEEAVLLVPKAVTVHSNDVS